MNISTLNLRHHMDRWEERFPLVVQTLLDADADLVGLQEVSIKLGPKNQAQLIADAINQGSAKAPYQVSFTLTREVTKDQEGIAILSRLPVKSFESVALPGPWRVAQMVTVEIEGRLLGFANTHLHHVPWRDESIRLPQAEFFMEWVNGQSFPCVMSGDYNAEPQSSTVLKVKETHRSAYETAHGKEPDFTCPTPLVKPFHDVPDTIDFLFYASEALRVTGCELIGTEPDPHDPTLYASDHFGLCAEFEWMP